MQSNTCRSFLGAVGFYRRFIPNFSEIAAPLTDLTKDNYKFKWTNKHHTAFITLKEALLTAPVLRLPDFGLTFIVVTDASLIAVGGVLMQNDGESEGPIAYESRKLNDAESRYPVHEQDYLPSSFVYVHGDVILKECNSSYEQTTSHYNISQHKNIFRVGWFDRSNIFNNSPSQLNISLEKKTS